MTMGLVLGTQWGGYNVCAGPVDSLCHFLQIHKATDCRKEGQSWPGGSVGASCGRRRC